MKIGYARVSTDEQNLGLQRDALEAAGCDRVFADEGVSGVQVERDGLSQALGMVGKGDVLVVWKLDRLGRSLGFLIDLIDRLGRSGGGFISLSESIDTTNAGGRLVFHMMGALAEFERSLIAERTKAGMASARRRGKQVGRPRDLPPIFVHPNVSRAGLLVDTVSRSLPSYKDSSRGWTGSVKGAAAGCGVAYPGRVPASRVREIARAMAG